MNKFLLSSVFILITISGLLIGCKKNQAIRQGEVLKVPPPQKPATETDSIKVIDNVKFEVTPYFWVNLLPTLPSEKPPFYLSLQIKITNNSTQEITDFSALAISLYNAGSSLEFHSFLLVPVEKTQLKEKIPIGETKILNYTNDRTEVFSPQIDKKMKLYGRVLINLNETQQVLTTIPTPVEFTY